MGRPKNNTNELSATIKIENAFWYVLEHEGYKNITILRLSQESGLNRNSIYYHYQNIEDVAKKAVAHNMNQEIVISFMSNLLSNNKFTPNQELLHHLKRIHFLARSESPFLQSFIKKTLLNAWFAYFNIDTTKLSDFDLASLDFIASGITSMLGSQKFINNPETIYFFPFTPIGIMCTL